MRETVPRGATTLRPSYDSGKTRRGKPWTPRCAPASPGFLADEPRTGRSRIPLRRRRSPTTSRSTTETATSSTTWPASGRTGGYNAGSSRDQFMMRHFGYRMRYGKLTRPDNAVESDVMERQFHEWLRRTGALSGRVLNVDKDYDRKFALTPDAMGSKIDQALDFLNTADDGRFRPLAAAVGASASTTWRASVCWKRSRPSTPRARSSKGTLRARPQGRGVSQLQRGRWLPSPSVRARGMEDAGAHRRQDPEGRPHQAAARNEFVARNPYVADIDTEVGDLASPLEQLQARFSGRHGLQWNGPAAANAPRRSSSSTRMAASAT